MKRTDCRRVMLAKEEARTSELAEKKSKGCLAAEESVLLWRKQQEYARIKKIHEQSEVLQMMDKYYPWGTYHQQIKPRGLRNLRLEGLFPLKDYQQSQRYALGMGRPGGGAPNVSECGQRSCRTREDPLLRFQWGKDLRKCVDNTLRYRMTKEEQTQYKKELDKLVEEKFKQKEKERLEETEKSRHMASKGQHLMEKITRDTETHSKRIRYGDSMGKRTTLLPILPSNQNMKRDKIIHPSKCCSNLSQNNHWNPSKKQAHFVKPTATFPPKNMNQLSSSSPSEEKGSGVELVPLMIEKRSPLKIPLATTDVTKNGYVNTSVQKWVIDGQLYLQELSKQMNQRLEQLKEMRIQDVEGTKKHFSTWDNFWGRPGHGAPRSSIKKTSIDKLLYCPPQNNACFGGRTIITVA